MKANFLKFGFLAILFAMTIFTTACNNNANESKTGKEHTSSFVCPMHCEGSGSEEEDICPTCGMDYVANESHNEDKHEH